MCSIRRTQCCENRRHWRQLSINRYNAPGDDLRLHHHRPYLKITLVVVGGCHTPATYLIVSAKCCLNVLPRQHAGLSPSSCSSMLAKDIDSPTVLYAMSAKNLGQPPARFRIIYNNHGLCARAGGSPIFACFLLIFFGIRTAPTVRLKGHNRMVIASTCFVFYSGCTPIIY